MHSLVIKGRSKVEVNTEHSPQSASVDKQVNHYIIHPKQLAYIEQWDILCFFLGSRCAHCIHTWLIHSYIQLFAGIYIKNTFKVTFSLPMVSQRSSWNHLGTVNSDISYWPEAVPDTQPTASKNLKHAIQHQNSCRECSIYNNTNKNLHLSSGNYYSNMQQM